jgi:hypothetical protein
MSGILMTQKNSTIENNIDVESDSELDTTIRRVKNELRGVNGELRRLFARRKDLILELGGAFEKVVSDHGNICEKIKATLREEIASRVISARDIERYCPDHWKRKTKPNGRNDPEKKEAEYDKLSFSVAAADKAVEKEAINVCADDAGSSILEPYHHNSDHTVQAPHSTDDDKNHCTRCPELELEIERLKEELLLVHKKSEQRKELHVPSSSTTMAAAVNRIKIPKKKQRDLINAMQSSRHECYIDLDSEGSIIAINSDNAGLNNESNGSAAAGKY